MNRGRETHGRTTRLSNDLAEMQKLSRLVPAIRFIKDNVSSYPAHYKIDIDIQGLVKEGTQAEPVYHNGFRLDVKLPIEYPHSSLPQCLISPFPFHPHFQKYTIEDFGLQTIPYYLKGGWSWGMWIPYELQNQGLGMFILGVVRSLKYDSDFIIEHAPQIGNIDALNWYKQVHLKHPNIFPIDKSPLPDSIYAPSKKFSMRTKFDLQSDDLEEGNDEPSSHPRLVLQTEPTPKKFTIDKVIKKTFTIEEISPAYQLEICEKPEFPTFMHADIRNPVSTHEIYILSDAQKKILNHIDWGITSNTNVVEQGGILLGQVYKDIKSGVVFAIIENAIEGQSAKGSSAYLEMGHDTWKEMIDSVDEMLDLNPEHNLQIVGWYHTHPNRLDVFMSGTDRNTQKRIFAQNWHFAIVLNPHKKIWRAFHGRNSEECSGFMIKDVPNDKTRTEDCKEQENTPKPKKTPPCFMSILIVLTVLVLGIFGIFYRQIFSVNISAASECEEALLLDEIDNIALSFSNKIVVSNDASNADIVLHKLDGELYFFSPHLLDKEGRRTGFVTIDAPLDAIIIAPIDVTFSEQVVLSNTNTIIAVSQYNVYAKVAILAIEGNPPERFIKLTACPLVKSE
jgi:proteasome lid subunit RPN8/RPN11